MLVYYSAQRSSKLKIFITNKLFVRNLIFKDQNTLNSIVLIHIKFKMYVDIQKNKLFKK